MGRFWRMELEGPDGAEKVIFCNKCNCCMQDCKII